MNSFSGWYLSPLFQFELKKNTEELSNTHKLRLYMENEVDFSSADFQFAKDFYGELKPKNLYQMHEKEKTFLFIFPNNAAKKLSFQAPGRAHLACQMGAHLASALSPLLLKDMKNFSLHLSHEVKNSIHTEEAEFLLGLLQRSVHGKIKKQDWKQKFSYIQLSEENFSKENIQKANAISTAMSITRSLIHMPANALNPSTYETLVRSLFRYEIDKSATQGDIDVNVLDYETLLHENCNLICAVGQGSHHKPRIIKLSYFPKSSSAETKHVTLVGKGITFDTGGYDIKSATGMRAMKKDMGGSAAALGTFIALATTNAPVKLTCYLAVAENMISGNAMRPGDVYKTRNGLHIEIENTDAEGRLVLADALCLASEEKPNWIIDFATLTGAARVSLGPMVDSLFGNNKVTTDLLSQSSLETGDWVWPMPLVSDYENYLDSSLADMMNSSAGAYAGSITAALFLQKFIHAENWNHIDTFMWCDKPHFLWQEGSSPTAKCVRLVTRAIEQFILS